MGVVGVPHSQSGDSRLSTLASRCSNVKWNGSSFKCSCPVAGHGKGRGDKTPSLHVSAGDKGYPVASCMAGCAQVEVIAALKSLCPEAFDRDRIDGRRRQLPPGATSTAPLAVATTTKWNSLDANKNVVAVHVRVDRPGAEKKIWWTDPNGVLNLPKGVGVADLLLYGHERLPKPEGDSLTAVLVEGEKPTDALLENGIPAVGTVTGAATIPGDKALSVLLPYRVVLWPDADAPGAKHMQLIGDALKRLGHEDVAIFSWPNAPAGGDAYDFFQQEAAIDEYLTLLDDAVSYPPPIPVNNVVAITTATKAPPVTVDNALDYPEGAMRGALGDFARVYSAHLEAPPHFFFSAGLTALGSIVSDRLTLNSEINPQPRMFTLLLGESADERKSTALSKSVDFFRGLCEAYAEQEFPTCWGCGSAEGLAALISKDKPHTSATEPRKMLLALDEMSQFVEKAGIKGSVLLHMVTSLFESNNYENHTKSSSIKLDRAHLSILACSTVDTYQSCWSSQFSSIGFTNRIWVVPGNARRRFAIPRRVSEGDRFALRNKFIKVLDHIGKRREYHVTERAHELYQQWYMDRPRSVHSRRLDVYALRIMPLLAANELMEEIDVDVVNMVIALCDHQYKARQVYDPIDADSEIAKMEERIRRTLKGRGPATERDLKKACHLERKGIWMYENAKKNLLMTGEMTYDRATDRYGLIPGVSL